MMTLLGKAVLGDFQIKQLIQKINAVSDFVVKDIKPKQSMLLKAIYPKMTPKKHLNC